jgi:hypothetical protein
MEGRFLITPPFSVAKDRTAIMELPIGITSACFNIQPRLPLRLDSVHGCFLIGTGIPYFLVQDESPTYNAEVAHPLMAIVGARMGVAWQISRSLYVKPFAEIVGSPARTHLTYNGRDMSGAFSFFGGFFGIQLSAVWNQPATWDRPVINAVMIGKAKLQ